MNIIFNTQKPKYIQIYDFIVKEINNGTLKSNTKLPSKRTLSLDLNVSISTVESAYYLLIDEGYIYTIEKKGYFISNQTTLITKPVEITTIEDNNVKYRFDFTTKSIEEFGNANLKKAIREVLDNDNYLAKTPLMGDIRLRTVIKKHLNENRGISVSIDNILITPGLECFKEIIPLCNVDNLYIENPGYHKLANICDNMNIIYQELDNDGVTIPDSKGILYTTPFNQFPTGIKMSISRKKELVAWANNTNSYIIEDDFDAEFRINTNPTTSLYSIIPNKVFFFSTFSTTLFPGIRISYVIIPDGIGYKEKYSYLSNPVSTLIQLSLMEFINKGYYSKLINSIKKRYIQKRKKAIEALETNGIGYDNKRNYLSLLIDYPINDETREKLIKKGILINSLSDYDFYKKTQNKETAEKVSVN